MGFKAATTHLLLVITVFLPSPPISMHTLPHIQAQTHTNTYIHAHTVDLIEEKVVQRDRMGGVCA